jgi:hypothetical protein
VPLPLLVRRAAVSMVPLTGAMLAACFKCTLAP